jgi:hypothetical protein
VPRSGAGVREEQRLAVDPVVGDRLLPRRRHQGWRAGFTAITPYWLNSRLSPSSSTRSSPRLRKLSQVPRSVSRYAFIPEAVFSAGPMPEPVSRYQGLRARSISTPASFQSLSSAAWVPLRSPRDTKGACAAAILRSASVASFSPPSRAGSAAGPTITKSLNITSWRPVAKPSATNRRSASRSWTSTTSASPRRAVSSAWPVPSATTRTSMPVCFVNAGSRCLNSPDCSVEVVDATTMNDVCAHAAAQASQAAAATSSERRRIGSENDMPEPLRWKTMKSYEKETVSSSPSGCC